MQNRLTLNAKIACIFLKVTNTCLKFSVSFQDLLFLNRNSCIIVPLAAQAHGRPVLQGDPRATWLQSVQLAACCTAAYCFPEMA